MNLYVAKIGTILVGTFFNTFLYGLVTYQFAAYHRRSEHVQQALSQNGSYPTAEFNDALATKCIVFFLFVLDTFHSAAAIYTVWYYTVENYCNPAVLALGVWSYYFTPIGTAIVAVVTQMYLGFRIWRLTNKKILYGVVIVIGSISFVLGVATGILAFAIQVLSKLPRVAPVAVAWLTTQVIVDVFITTTLTIVFFRWRGGFRKTDTILNRLIRGAVQTGLFAGIFSLAVLITFVIAPDDNLYGMFAIPVGRIYTNTLLDTLLTRETIRKELNRSYDVNPSSGPLYWPPGSNSTQGTSTTNQSTGIPVKVPSIIQENSDHSLDSERKTDPLVAV